MTMALTVLKNSNQNKEQLKIISDRAYYIVITATLFFGFAVNAAEVWFLTDFFLTWNPSVFYIVYLITAVAGIVLNTFSKKPVISFIGYCLVILPLGAALTLIVPYYSMNVVRSAFLVTALLTGAFILLAILYPKIFYSMWRVLSISLSIALLWMIINMFTSFAMTSFVWVDWLVVLIFCCYIGFDISFAKSKTKTLDNAIDSACGLYLDIINLFVRLLIIFGRHD